MRFASQLFFNIKHLYINNICSFIYAVYFQFYSLFIFFFFSVFENIGFVSHHIIFTEKLVSKINAEGKYNVL